MIRYHSALLGMLGMLGRRKMAWVRNSVLIKSESVAQPLVMYKLCHIFLPITFQRNLSFQQPSSRYHRHGSMGEWTNNVPPPWMRRGFRHTVIGLSTYSTISSAYNTSASACGPFARHNADCKFRCRPVCCDVRGPTRVKTTGAGAAS